MELIDSLHVNFLWNVITSIFAIVVALISLRNSFLTSIKLKRSNEKLVEDKVKDAKIIEKLELEIDLLKKKLEVSENIIKIPEKEIKEQIEEFSNLNSLLKKSISIANEFLSCQNKLFESQNNLKNLINSLNSDRKKLSLVKVNTRFILDSLIETATQIDTLNKAILSLLAGDIEQLEQNSKKTRLS